MFSKPGSGYRYCQAFMRRSQVGYTLIGQDTPRKYGCSGGIWPGSFADAFNYSAQYPGPPNFPFWNVLDFGGGLGGTAVAGSGSILVHASHTGGGANGFRPLWIPNCANAKGFTFTDSSITVVGSGDTARVGGFFTMPCLEGGPTGLVFQDGLGNTSGYWARFYNNFNIPYVASSTSDFVTFEIKYFLNATSTTLATTTLRYTDTVDHNGFTGWTNNSHVIRLTAQASGLNNNALTAYVDGAALLSYTDTRVGIPSTGTFGFMGASTADGDRFSYDQAVKMSSFKAFAH